MEQNDFKGLINATSVAASPGADSRIDPAPRIAPFFRRMSLLVAQWIDRLVWRILTWAGGENHSPAPVVWKLGALLTLTMAVGVVIGLLVPSLGIGWHYGEGDVMTWWSTLALASCASISHRIGTLRTSQQPSSSSMWKVFTIGFIFLAADELLRIHESLDRTLHRIAGVRPVGLTDHLDDLIVALYGFAVVFVLLRNVSEVKRYFAAKWYFLGAVIAGVSTVSLDFLASAKWLWLTVWSDLAKVQQVIAILDVTEETFKIYAELFFIGALLVCLRIVVSTDTHKASAA